MSSVDPNPAPATTNVVNEVVREVPAVVAAVKESKAGYKTTEFWLTVGAAVLVQVQALPVPEKYQGIVAAALAGVYAISRGLAKKGIPAVEPVDAAPEA